MRPEAFSRIAPASLRSPLTALPRLVLSWAAVNNNLRLTALKTRTPRPVHPQSTPRGKMRAAAARQAIRLARSTLTRPIHPSAADLTPAHFHLFSQLHCLLSPPILFCRHARTKAANGSSKKHPRQSSPTPYTLPAPSSFPSLAVFTQHVVSSRTTPTTVKATLSTARSLLGPDAYELLISLLTAAQPSPVDIAAALAEVRPFALEHERERRQAKLKLVQPRRTQQQQQQQGEPQQQYDHLRPQLDERLDERAMAQLQRSLTSIAKYIKPNPTPTPTSGNENTVAPHHTSTAQQTTTAAPSPQPPPSTARRPPPARSPSAARSHNPTRQLLTQLSTLLPPLHFQALLRCFLYHATTPLTNLRLQERHLATIRHIVSAAGLPGGEDKGWGVLYGQYKGVEAAERAGGERVYGVVERRWGRGRG